MNIRPLHDRVVAKRKEREEEIRGGIIIPDSAKEKPLEAEVIAVGPGKLNDSGERTALTVKVGDNVLIGKYSGTEVKLGDQDLIVLREDDILGIID
jgi:chaperonin GroES